MATKTPADIIREKIETQKGLKAAGFFKMVEKDKADARHAQLTEDAVNGRLADAAKAVADARHSAAMSDYKSGHALARAIEGYKVKRSVADLAMAEGKSPNGTNLPVVAEVKPGTGLVPAQSDKSFSVDGGTSTDIAPMGDDSTDSDDVNDSAAQ